MYYCQWWSLIEVEKVSSLVTKVRPRKTGNCLVIVKCIGYILIKKVLIMTTSYDEKLPETQ